MNRRLRKFFGFGKGNRSREIDPEEVLLDSRNLPQFDTDQFEGRIEKPISGRSIAVLGIFFLLIGFLYVGKVWNLQIAEGEVYAARSENNRLKHTLLFAERGVIYDRNGTELAWNVPGEDKSFSIRKYFEGGGFGHILGYIKYPSKDAQGFYYREDYLGMDGVEKLYADRVQGENGLRIVETDALGKVLSESVIKPPKPGESLTLSLDAKVQSKLYNTIKDLSETAGFAGGAGVIMDIHTGELIAMTSYPEYDSTILSEGKDKAVIDGYLTDPNKPFLNRAIDGAYTPGSIIKPFMALAALNEHVIDPNKAILSTGSISVPNPYDPTKKTVFNDWKAHGWVDMRKAISVSSNVYFYEVGGGFEDQKGLGITNIEKYMRLFGYGAPVEDPFMKGASGVIPDPEWKAKNFDGDIWRVGDTYFTAIGQYGFQVTPIQVARGMSLIANEGTLLMPSLFKGVSPNPDETKTVDLPHDYFTIVKEGMRMSAVDGTAKGLNVPYVKFAAKTGTAELGVSKKLVNSWVAGFFPYETPRYAFAIIMEKGSRNNTVGATYVGRQLFDWMSVNTPEYFKLAE